MNAVRSAVTSLVSTYVAPGVSKMPGASISMTSWAQAAGGANRPAINSNPTIVPVTVCRLIRILLCVSHLADVEREARRPDATILMPRASYRNGLEILFWHV